MIKKIVAFTAVVILISAQSCKKFLEVTPQFEFTSATAIASLDGLQKTTTGAFNQLQSSSLYGGGIIAYSELLADFVTCLPQNDYSLAQLRSRQMNSNNAEAAGQWDAAYAAIYDVNLVLQNADKFASQNAPAVATMKGECYFIRGIMYFELVRIFAQPSGYTPNDSHLGVPIVLVPGTITTGQSTPRSTVAQVYAQIESDLDSAYALLPTSTSARASQAAAAGFLTRAYFTQHNYQQALNWSNIVINNYGFSLTDSLLSPYNQKGNATTTETIFQEINQGLSVQNGVVYNDFHINFFGYVDFSMSPAFISYLQADSAAGSLRYSEVYTLGFNRQTGQSVYATNKYNGNGDNVCNMRLEEMLFDRAESNAWLGASASVVRADYNLSRVRAGLLPDNSTTGQAALIAACRGERDIELAMEGDRFYELKRRQQGFYEPEDPSIYFAWNSNQLIYPIPYQEVLENKNMVQNPGY